MSDSSPARSRGCLSRLISSFLFLSGIGLAVALFFAVQPQDLSDIDGHGEGDAGGARDLTTALRNSVDRGYDLKISEGDLNRWLKSSVTLRQGGVLAESVKLEEVAVRLEKDRAEVVFQRSVLGRPFTVSMFLRIEQLESSDGTTTALHRDGGVFLESLPKVKKGGRFGKLVVPQGMLLLVMPSYATLKSEFDEEVVLAFEKMVRVRIDDGALVLDPRENLGGVPPVESF